MNQHKLFLETTNIYEPLKKTEKCPQNVQNFNGIIIIALKRNSTKTAVKLTSSEKLLSKN